jgi:MFS family permease
LSILAVTFAEGVQPGRALGIYGTVTGMGTPVGLIASGLLTEGPGWRWVFLINVPIGVLLIATAAFFLAVDARDRRRSEHFTIAGAVTVTAGPLLLVYALNRAADLGWGSGSTLGLVAAAAPPARCPPARLYPTRPAAAPGPLTTRGSGYRTGARYSLTTT